MSKPNTTTPPYAATTPPPGPPGGDRAAGGEDAYRALMDRAGFGLYRASPHAGGRFVEVNAALVRMLGYEREEELLALELARDVYVEPAERDRLLARLAGLDGLEWVETRWRRRDGSPLIVRLLVHAVRAVHAAGGDGPAEEPPIVAYEGIVEDVTERRRQEELLRRSERMASLGTLVAGVAHELNNPLAAILGFAQLLLKRPLPDEDLAALETISHEAARSAMIVKDLLALARQRGSERRSPVHLNDVVGYIARTRRYSLETHGIACDLSLDPTLPLVLGDRAQLEQVILNLLANAEHALRVANRAREAAGVRAGARGEARDDPGAHAEPGDRAGGRIAVRTRREGEQVVLEVADDGPGIPADVRWRIWDPFWTTKDAGQGTGLGLSVVHGILAAHDGSIVVDDAAESGARFIVRLPAAPDAEAPGEDDATQDGAAAVRPLDVLVVDSQPDSLSFLTRFLTSRGHAVLATSEGKRALRLAERMHFDAVVCEAGLAGGGDDLLRSLRARPGGDRTRVVVAIGDPTDTSGLSVPLPPGVVVTLKPYDIEEMRLLIEG